MKAVEQECWYCDKANNKNVSFLAAMSIHCRQKALVSKRHEITTRSTSEQPVEKPPVEPVVLIMLIVTTK